MNALIHLLQPLCDVLAASRANGILLSAFLIFRSGRFVVSAPAGAPQPGTGLD